MTTEVKNNGSRDRTMELVQEVVRQAEIRDQMDGGNGAVARVPVAYHAYVDAQKRLGDAFKGRNRHDRLAYEAAARRFRACEQAIDRALKAREMAEQHALEAYKRSIDMAVQLASGVYRDAMKQALAECTRAIQQAWKESAETSEEMSAAFQRDDSVSGTTESPLLCSEPQEPAVPAPMGNPSY